MTPPRDQWSAFDEALNNAFQSLFRGREAFNNLSSALDDLADENPAHRRRATDSEEAGEPSGEGAVHAPVVHLRNPSTFSRNWDRLLHPDHPDPTEQYPFEKAWGYPVCDGHHDKQHWPQTDVLAFVTCPRCVQHIWFRRLRVERGQTWLCR